MPQPVWYAGICDSMLRKVHFWKISWIHGDSFATRPMVGDQAQIIDVVTKRSVPVCWKPDELKHLVRILKEVRPQWQMTLDLENLLRNINRAKMLAGGERLVHMRCYEQDPKDVLEVLLKVRAGESVEDELAKVVDEGGSIFDV